MEDNLKSILKKFEQLKGQFVITESHKIERFIAIAEDEFDYYYVTYDGRKITYNTCVGNVIELKGKIDDYEKFPRLAKMNHFEFLIKDEELLKIYKEELFNDTSCKLLTEICWDLN